MYVTNEPQIALNKRIRYCLSLYHETQKAITYPDMQAKQNDESKDAELDTEELMNLLDFDDDMWNDNHIFIFIFIFCINFVEKFVIFYSFYFNNTVNFCSNISFIILLFESGSILKKMISGFF